MSLRLGYLGSFIVAVLLPAVVSATEVSLTAQNSGYYIVSCAGVQVSQHTAEREAAESLLNQRSAGNTDCSYSHPYSVSVDYGTSTLNEISLTASGGGLYVVECAGVPVSQHTTERKAINSIANAMVGGDTDCTYTHNYTVAGEHTPSVVVVPPVDTDGDGVNDTADLCPNTPTAGTTKTVDANGCYVVVDSDGDGVADDVDLCPGTVPDGVQEIDADGCYVVVPPPVSSDLIVCPDAPTSVTASRTWTVCDVTSADKPEYTANGSDYIMSYRIPSTVTTDNKAQLYVYMHPSTSGDQFVSGSSSFDYSSAAAKNQIEIHNLEQTVGKNPDGVENSGGWWGYSGYDRGAVGNYNGKAIAASVCYVAAKHSDIVDLNKGLKLAGTSLGGAGSYIQSQLLPELISQECGLNIEISSVHSNWGIMNMTEASEIKVKSGWGTKAESPDLYDSTDLRLNWAKVQNAHFYWGGGQNDGLGRMSTDFMDTCELRKISCSFRWLQSGHSPNETGYTLPSGAWVDSKHYVTADVILPVITNNTANHRGELRGYVNRSIGWSHAAIVDTVDEIQVPLKYVAMKNIGPELPDQPDTMTFSITFRHVKNFDTSVGREVSWTFGTQSGTAVVGGDGLLTIDGLELPSADAYTVLSVKKASGVVVEPPAPTGLTYVYPRVPRTTVPYNGTLSDGTQYVANHLDHLDSLTEVSRRTADFNAPGQLVINRDGVEEIIYDCMDAERPCVANDLMWSLDGKKIAFAVMSSDGLKPPWPENKNYPNRYLNSKNNTSVIHIYDDETKELVAWPTEAGVRESGPVWLPNGRIMYTSTKDPQYGPLLNNIGTGNPIQRLFTANPDGTDKKDISPHELAGALHPYLLDSGRVAYSTHWMSHNLAYGSTNGGINWPGTTDNFWAVADIDQEGGDVTLLLGAHKRNMPPPVNGRSSTMKAFHFLGQRGNGDLCTANYYRKNNLGLGDNICWPPQPKGIEGVPGSFIPEGLYTIAKWSSSEDSTSFVDPDTGKYYGKVGFPAWGPNNQMVITYGKGACTSVTGKSVKAFSEYLTEKGRIGCDTGIYMTTKIPSDNPSDLVRLVDKPEWHEYGARVKRVRNIPIPALSKTGDDTCQVVSTDAGSTDAHNPKAYEFNNNYASAANSGGEIQDLPHSELAAVRFYEVIPNKVKKPAFKNSIGNEVKLIGDVPLLADNSFRAQVPCETPYLMAGVDSEGRLIKRDQVTQSLRTGEKRVCKGCHLHSEEGRPYDQSLAATAPPFVLPDALAVPTYEKDIKPIFEAKCTACHVDDVPVLDYEKLVWDYFQTHVPESKKVQVSTSTVETRRYGLHRPYISKYVNNMFARESLLYWKAANQRTDGRTDDTYNNDIDFGADHPTDLTDLEIKLIAGWLDSGAAQ